MLKPIRSISFLALALCLGGAVAQAQDADVFFGVARATDSSNGSVSSLTGVSLVAPKLDATFGKLGGGFMLNKRFGVGFQTDFQFSKANYQGFQTRPTFYDVNGIYTPFSGKYARIVPELQGGIGGVHMSYTYSSCNTLTCQTVPYASASHFALHVGAGVRFYATKHVFIRPQFDYRYVPNFTQYGSNSVPEYGAVVGYSFTEH